MVKKTIKPKKTSSTSKSGKAGTKPSFAKERASAKAKPKNKLKEQIPENNQKRVKAIMDNILVGIITIDEWGIVESMNPMSEKIFGYAASEVLGKNIKMLMPEPYRSEHDSYIRNYMKTGQAKVIGLSRELQARRKDGTIFPIELSINVVLADEHWLFTGVVRDISARRIVEEKLQKSERKLSTLVSNLPGMVYHCRNDKNWTMEYLSEGCMALTGYRPQDLIKNHRVSYGQNVIHPEDRENVWKEVQNALRKSESFQITYRIRTFTGEEKWVWEQGRGINSSDGDLEAVEGFITDITSNKRALQDFERSQKELRNLSQRLQTIREEEKKHIAREIHDELGQFLTALKMDLTILEDELNEDQKPLRERAQVMGGLIDSTIKSIQRICMELRPQILDVLGLSEAIEWQCQEYERNTGIICDLVLPKKKLNLDQDRSITCFRILQESLTNVTRHAEATRVIIKLENKKNYLVLKIEDNGKGINEEKLSDPNSLGLIGMRERTLVFNGNVKIAGCLGKGTTLTAEIPHK